MSNKWFQSARDRSDSESSDSSDEEKKTTTQSQAQGAKKGVAPARKYMKGLEDSSESEDEQRVVKTTKDKKLENLMGVLSDLKNHLKNRDFWLIMGDFEKLTDEIDKSQTSGGVIFDQAKDKDGLLPYFIVRAFVKIEDEINETQALTKEKKVSLNKQNSVSFNKLKQKIKKYLQTSGPTNNTYETQIAKFRENPVWSDDEKKKATKGKDDGKKKKVESDSEEEESEEEESEEEEEEEEESEESEEEIDIFKIPREQMTPAQRRLKWVKRDRLPAYLQAQLNQKQQAKNKDAAEKKKEQQDAKEKGAEDAKTIHAALGGVQAVVDKEAKETNLNKKNDFLIDYTKNENVYKKLREIQEERMKGKYDIKYHCQLLTYILEQAKDVRQKVEIILNLLNSLFETSKTSQSGFLNRDTWLITYNQLLLLMTLLETQSMKDQLKASLLKAKDVKSEESEDDDVESTQELSITVDVEKSILPSLANFLEKLDYELLKAFQQISHTKIEYLQRIRDENKFLFLCDSIQAFITEFGDLPKAARVAILKLDHLHYKNDSIYQKIKECTPRQVESYIIEGNSQEFVENLVTLINSYGTSKMKLRAALYQIYHHSIHKRFYPAKDLLLKTHIGDIIHLQDIGSQILYNRAITQIGMSAFRLGLIEESHDVLVEICQTARLREILAQGISRQIDKPVELEKEEQKRQVPFHLHINLQLLDCIYMISAMLLEISNIAENQYSVNKKIISKNFKKLIDQYDAKAFYLAPENYRDNIVYAAKALNKSNWKVAVDHIFSIRLIQKMPEFQDDGFKETLKLKFKETALRAFLQRAAKNYQSFSMNGLIENFEIPREKLVQMVKKMIVRNKIQAHFDLKNELLILDTKSNEVKELQQLSLQYVDKLEHMVENNERLIDMLAGGNLYAHKEKTSTEMSQINANRKNKLMIKAAGGGSYGGIVTQAQRQRQ